MKKSIFDILDRAEDVLLIAAFSGMAVLSFIQIILRNGFDSSIIWADVAVRILVLWVTVLGAMVATRRAEHIKIDIFSRFILLKYNYILTTIYLLGSSIVAALVAWYCYEMVVFEKASATIAFASVPVWVCQLILPIGFMVISFRFFVRSWQAVRERQS